MSRSDLSLLVEAVVSDLLRDSPAAQRRRCAIRQGRREPDQANCTHDNWDRLKHWCRDCGVTAEELMYSGRFSQRRWPWIVGQR